MMHDYIDICYDIFCCAFFFLNIDMIYARCKIMLTHGWMHEKFIFYFLIQRKISKPLYRDQGVVILICMHECTESLILSFFLQLKVSKP